MERRVTPSAMVRVRRIAKHYELNDIFNADELGLADSAASTSTIGSASLVGRDKKT